jgi:1-acyl-sn-glycerol-3-phosphate acyltransferase
MQNILATIYLNFTFYLLFIVFSLISIPLLTLFVVFVGLVSPQRKTMKIFRRAIRWYATIIVRVFPFPLIRIQYRDFEKDKDNGPYIFVCNHRSTSDVFLMSYLPYECIVVVNMWPFRIPVLGIIARLAGYLNVRKMPFEKFLRSLILLFKQGVSVIVFPEGTRSNSKEMGQFHSAIFRVALESRCPIAPLCITGNENIPARGSFLLRPGMIKIHKLAVLQWRDYKNLTAFALKNKVREMMAGELKLMEQ